MYKIRFNTENFEDRNRRSWENQLNNDFAVAINGKEFIYNNRAEALDRLEFIAGRGSITIKTEDKENYIYLEHERYSKQFMLLKMPGFAQGYVNLQRVLDTAEQLGHYRIPFNLFYDLRQGNFFKNCFVEITVTN